MGTLRPCAALWFASARVIVETSNGEFPWALPQARRYRRVCAAFVAVTGGVRAEDAFYKGKRLTVLVNYAPGGSTDAEARVFVRHIGRVLEGQPAVIIQNMEGAGGFVGAKYVGEVAPRDGTVAGYFTATAFLAALEPERFKVDFKSYDSSASRPAPRSTSSAPTCRPA